MQELHAAKYINLVIYESNVYAPNDKCSLPVPCMYEALYAMSIHVFVVDIQFLLFFLFR